MTDDDLAARLRGFGPLGVFTSLIIVLLGSLGGIPALLWAHFSGTPLRELGFIRPGNWIGTITLGAAAGVAFELLMKSVILPLLGAPATNQAYHFLVGNAAALPGMILTLFILAGFGEETVFRGFLFARLGKLFGTSAVAKMAMVVIGASLFSVAHYYDQGLAGMKLAAVTGLVFGTIFSITGRIWFLMVMHVAFDLMAIAIIYFNRESWFSHLVFK